MIRRTSQMIRSWHIGQRTLSVAPGVLDLVGIGLLVWAGWQIAEPLGAAVAGVGSLITAWRVSE
jgi:divalent metal cation (Fe/Co/Zn/Cd) transporter